MGLFKRGSVYWYKFEIKGREYRGTTRCSNGKEAKTVMDKVRLDVVAGTYEVQKKKEIPTLSEFKKPFMDDVRLRRPKSVEFYEYKYDMLLTFKPLADEYLDKIEHQVVNKFITKKLAEGYERAGVNRSLATLRKALRLARKWHIIKYHVQVELLNGEKKREFVVSREWEPTFITSCPTWLRPVCEFIIDTGVRIEELCALQWEDIVWEPVGRAKRGYIKIIRGKSVHAKRNLTITKRVLDILKRQKSISQCKYVFTSVFDKTQRLSQSTVQHAFDNLREKHPDWNQELVPHTLRHTFGTRLGEAGVGAFDIMRLMGHGSISMTQRYVHPTPEALERAVMGMEDMAQIIDEGVGTVGSVQSKKMPKSGTRVGTISGTVTTENIVEFRKAATGA